MKKNRRKMFKWKTNRIWFYSSLTATY